MYIELPTLINESTTESTVIYGEAKDALYLLSGILYIIEDTITIKKKEYPVTTIGLRTGYEHIIDLDISIVKERILLASKKILFNQQ